MSLDVQRDTSTPPPSAPLGSASSGSEIPIRAKLSLLRQHFILAIRWFFRLEIDDIKERKVQATLDGLTNLHQEQAQTIGKLTTVITQLQARLKWYEDRIPRMRELKKDYEREQAKLRQTYEDKRDDVNEDLANGIVGTIRS